MLRLLASLRRAPFWAQIVAGLVLGVILGLVARTYDVTWLATTLDTIGGIFVGLLKAAVPPLVFTAIVVSIANLRQVANAARLATQTLVWFMITSLIAVAIGAAALKAGEKAEPFLGFMRSALAVIQQVLWWIIKLAPSARSA